MSKSMVLLFAGIFGVLGAYAPILLGDNTMFSMWSILGSMIGGFFGIWFAVWLNKRLS